MTGWKRVALLLFAIGWGANHFVALLLMYRTRLALDPAAPAILVAIYALGLVPGLLLSGPLSDRFGRRKLVLPGAMIALAGTAILGAGGDSFVLLLLGRLIYGLGCGVVMNPGSVWVLELSGDAAGGSGARRATIALSAGFGFGPLLSGALAQYAPAPTVLPYAAHAVALIAAIAIGAGAPGGQPSGARGPLLRIGLDRTNRAAFFGGIAPMAPFVFAFAVIAFATLPALLGSATPAYIGVVAAVALASGVLAQPMTRQLSPAISARLGLVLGAAGCALGATMVALQLAPLLLPSAAILGAGYGICMTAGLRRVLACAKPETLGGLTGFYLVLTYLGFAAPWLIALATRHLAPEPVLAIVAGLALAAAAALRS